MKWLTKAEVKREAKKGEIPAIKCSLKHWDQISSATRQELIRKLRSGKRLITGDSCALCQRHRGNGFCPFLNRICTLGWGCTKTFDDAGSALYDFQRNNTESNYVRAIKKSVIVRDKLRKVLQRYESKEKNRRRHVQG